ncbi:MAG: allophanate hydrolase subunit 2 family protein, partial [Actinomycetales bacterium]
MNAVVVEAVGPLALIEDLGRPGHASVGVTGSGAADRRALRLANRLLGNAEGAAGVEVLLGGLAVRADGDVRVCVTGAPAPVLVDGRAAPLGAPLELRDGQLLTLG